MVSRRAFFNYAKDLGSYYQLRMQSYFGFSLGEIIYSDVRLAKHNLGRMSSESCFRGNQIIHSHEMALHISSLKSNSYPLDQVLIHELSHGFFHEMRDFRLRKSFYDLSDFLSEGFALYCEHDCFTCLYPRFMSFVSAREHNYHMNQYLAVKHLVQKHGEGILFSLPTLCTKNKSFAKQFLRELSVLH